MSHSKKHLNETEILKILKKSEPSKIVTVTDWTLIEKEDQLLGFLGNYYSLKIEALIDDRQKTKYFFVKTLPENVEDGDILEGVNLFHKESIIYSKIFEIMPASSKKWTPSCFYTRSDILVLEDLSQENYQIMPKNAHFSKIHIQLVLKSLATLHANSFYLEKCILRSPIDAIHGDLLSEVSVTKSNGWFHVGLNAIKTVAITRTKFSHNPDMIKLIEANFTSKITDQVIEICNNYSVKFRKVLCHRDIWRNNIMFKFNRKVDGEIDFNSPTSAALIDYQIARYMPPGADVMMTLFLLQRIKDREIDYQENIKYYYYCLNESLKNLNLKIDDFLSYEEFLETCEYFKLLVAVLKCVFIPMSHLPDGEIEKLYANKEIYHKFIMEDRGEISIKFIDTNEFFRNWMIESVEELIEMTFDQRFFVQSK
uniref:CSON005415 protein n=1 Tax=Culicoides sonorensis TaxID=179676 RepID=A0A336MUK5_CULSO